MRQVYRIENGDCKSCKEIILRVKANGYTDRGKRENSGNI